ncbi:MAG: hypothetical protein ISS82_03400 [Nanoarchaeota archaeon]|nr:hypothetical protein [Nanoarchaeota archaeon]
MGKKNQVGIAVGIALILGGIFLLNKGDTASIIIGIILIAIGISLIIK